MKTFLFQKLVEQKKLPLYKVFFVEEKAKNNVKYSKPSSKNPTSAEK